MAAVQPCAWPARTSARPTVDSRSLSPVSARSKSRVFVNHQTCFSAGNHYRCQMFFGQSLCFLSVWSKMAPAVIVNAPYLLLSEHTLLFCSDRVYRTKVRRRNGKSGTSSLSARQHRWKIRVQKVMHGILNLAYHYTSLCRWTIN